MALTGSSTCTLIAFVFPALLFVQAAKEAQGKSDAPVRIYPTCTYIPSSMPDAPHSLATNSVVLVETDNSIVCRLHPTATAGEPSTDGHGSWYRGMRIRDHRDHSGTEAWFSRRAWQAPSLADSRRRRVADLRE